MKRKYLTKTYLRDVPEYEIKMYLDIPEYYLVIKKLKEVTNDFVAYDGIKLLAKNYYIVEVVPKNENYAMRVFLDDKKNILEYYFDIINKAGIDKDMNVPYFDDLYLDIIVYKGKIRVVDADELIEALKEDIITKKQYDMAMKIKENLINEINNNTNLYYNSNIITKYLD
jgi:uncharacterized protein